MNNKIFIVLILIACLCGCNCQRSDETTEEESKTTEEEVFIPISVPYDGQLRLVAAHAEYENNAIPVDSSGIIVMPPGGAMYIETWQRLEDHRVRFVNEADRLVPFSLESGPVAMRSDGSEKPGGTWIRLQPLSELVPGQQYYLRIEPEIGEKVTDHKGLEYDDLVLEIRLQDTTEPEAQEIAEEEEGSSGEREDEIREAVED